MTNKLDGLVIKKGLVYQEVDLKELFGVDVSEYSDLKAKFAQACIDAIVDRCKRGLDVFGDKLPNYSEGYTKSAEFIAYGKSKNQPNEKLHGDMLASLDLLKNTGNIIQFGWNDEFNAEKARGHITGYEGHKFLAGSPRREFFGLTRPQLEQIMISFEADIKQVREKQKEKSGSDSTSAMLLGYFSQLEANKKQSELKNLLGIGFDDGNDSKD